MCSIILIVRFCDYMFLVDGTSPSLACATVGGKVLIHNPHTLNKSTEGESVSQFLNFNRKITSLTSGRNSDNYT